MENFKELVQKNRSYRRFRPGAPLPRELMASFVDTARFAASSVNRQPLKYYISADADTNARLRSLTGWAALLPDYNGPAEGENPTGYIVICCDTRIGNMTRFAADVGIVAQTIMLDAVSKGYGGCMIGNFNQEKASEALKLPEEIRPLLILALGVPDEEIILEECAPDGDTAYYRDADGRHHVPKRRLEDILL